MSKLVIKAKYGVVPNDILNNPNLSLKAKGLFCFIQSKPDDWDFSIERIATQTNDGTESIRTAIHELEKAGYLSRKQSRDDTGRMDGYEYTLTENCPSPEITPTECTGTDLYKECISKQEVVNKIKHSATRLKPVADCAGDKSPKNPKDDDPMDLKGFSEWCAESKQRHVEIIAAWARAVKPDCRTRGQWGVFIRRNVRPAKELIPFTEGQIQEAYVKMMAAANDGKYLKKYTLETLAKFLI
jgi:hypothetical protein